MIVHVDTSALVDALTGPRRSLDTLIGLTDGGHRLALSTMVLYEWLRSPRTRAELGAQEESPPHLERGVLEAGPRLQLDPVWPV
jgi:predicted nucleic acid-binding protein